MSYTSTSHQPSSPHLLLSARLTNPLEVFLTCCHYLTCLRIPTLWKWAWSLSISGLPVYCNCLLIFLCPHNRHRTDLLPFIFSLLSEESFLFMFWWFLGSLPNQLSPLLATTVSKASDEHFISSGVNFTVEWEIWKQALQLEHKTLRFVMMRKANSRNRVTVWPFLLPHSPYKIMTVFYISLATLSHLLLAYQMTLSNGSSLLPLHLHKDQRGGPSSAKFLLIHSPFWKLLSSFTKKDPNIAKIIILINEKLKLKDFFLFKCPLFLTV